MLHDILQKTILNNRILDYLLSFTIFLIAIFCIRVLEKIFLYFQKVRAEKKKKSSYDIFYNNISTAFPLLYFGAFYLSMQYLNLNLTLEKIINTLGLILLVIFCVRFLLAVIKYDLENYWIKREENIFKKHAIDKIIKGIKILIWGLAIVLILDNLGINISTLLAGVGIGGAAAALAAQEILKDIFNYISIRIDRPFEIDDFIIVGDKSGTVNHIGVLTTRIRSLGGEQIIIPNSDLTSSRVHNYKRMDKRWVKFRLYISYHTALQDLKEIPTIIRNIIESINDTTFDRSHFFDYELYRLIIETAYFIIGSDYNKYMDIQQEINLAIKEEFEKRGIEFS